MFVLPNRKANYPYVGVTRRVHRLGNLAHDDRERATIKDRIWLAPGAYRIRIADYRLLYEVHATEIVVYVIGAADRREVYLRLLRRRNG